MEQQQQFIGVVEPFKPRLWTKTPRLPPMPDAWFENDSEQLRLFDERTPDHVSPLWYTGAKYYLYHTLMNRFISPDTKEILSPFMGGCSLELYLAASGIKVYAYDNFEPVVQFFQQFNADSAAVTKRVLEIFPIYKGDDESRARYVHLIRGGGWHELECPIDKAAHMWAISRQSFMGRNFTSLPVEPHHATRYDFFRKRIQAGIMPKGYHNLWEEWHNPNIEFGLADFRDSLAKHPDMLAYLDPPYIQKNIFYGEGKQDEFGHVELRDMLAERGRFILSYGNHEDVWTLYKGFTILTPQWQYKSGRTASGLQSAELLIVSDDIAEYHKRSVS